ncbi:MAG: ABC transporter ATP-binding protein [Clostridia bacterium]|nr:ABC transporter ATP-binding protein [Clostridia bacterium]
MKIEGLTFSFEDKVIFENLNLEIEDGCITALMAPSGNGKTTLLRLIAGLLKPQDGSIDIQNRSVGIMFQDPRLFGQLTALQNVMMVVGDKSFKKQRAMQLLQAFHLADAANKYPDELSGGMAKRISLARAIAYDADILLLDEPFSALDKDTKALVMDAAKPFLKGKTVLLVTHDIQEAEAFADKVIHLP